MDAHPTTTNAKPGAGRPRLVFSLGGSGEDGELPREFDLVAEVTSIGSAADADLRLDGLDPVHAEIRHNDVDEYVLFVLGDAKLSADSEHDEPGEGHALRTGSRLELGDWALSFARDEFADHGRPFGGRQGGEFEHQQPQPER